MHANNTKSTYVHLTYSDTQKAHLCLSENTYICIVPCTSNGTGHVNTRIIMTDKNHDILTFHKPDTSSRQELPLPAAMSRPDSLHLPTISSTRRST